MVSVGGFVFLMFDGQDKKLTKKLFGKSKKTAKDTEETPVNDENDTTSGDSNE